MVVAIWRTNEWHEDYGVFIKDITPEVASSDCVSEDLGDIQSKLVFGHKTNGFPSFSQYDAYGMHNTDWPGRMCAVEMDLSPITSIDDPQNAHVYIVATGAEKARLGWSSVPNDVLVHGNGTLAHRFGPDLLSYSSNYYEYEMHAHAIIAPASLFANKIQSRPSGVGSSKFWLEVGMSDVVQPFVKIVKGGKKLQVVNVGEQADFRTSGYLGVASWVNRPYAETNTNRLQYNTYAGKPGMSPAHSEYSSIDAYDAPAGTNHLLRQGVANEDGHYWNWYYETELNNANDLWWLQAGNIGRHAPSGRASFTLPSSIAAMKNPFLKLTHFYERDAADIRFSVLIDGATVYFYDATTGDDLSTGTVISATIDLQGKASGANSTLTVKVDWGMFYAFSASFTFVDVGERIVTTTTKTTAIVAAADTSNPTGGTITALAVLLGLAFLGIIVLVVLLTKKPQNKGSASTNVVHPEITVDSGPTKEQSDATAVSTTDCKSVSASSTADVPAQSTADVPAAVYTAQGISNQK